MTPYFETDLGRLYHGDCLEIMQALIDDVVTVDAVITDPPYGTIKGCRLWNGPARDISWDVRINTGRMFDACAKLLRVNGRLLLFSQEPYTSELVTSYPVALPFSYKLFWIKDGFANGLIARKAPTKYVEEICAFQKVHDVEMRHPLRDYAKRVHAFIGQPKKRIIERIGQRAARFLRHDSTQFARCTEATYNELITVYGIDNMPGFLPYEELRRVTDEWKAALTPVFNLPDGKRHKPNILQYKRETRTVHPTQKPVALIEDLIRTYTNPGDLVLDFTLGSGTTAIAAERTGRRWIGIELSEGYCEIAAQRIGGTHED